jgi:hypothetical protein
MKRSFVAAAAAAAALALPASALAGTATLDRTLARGKGRHARVLVHLAQPAPFHVLLRLPTSSRFRLYVRNALAPEKLLLIDSATYGCEGAAGSFYCEGSYEALPAGNWYLSVWKLTKPRAHVRLEVSW